MADREDASVDGMEPTALQAMADRPPAHPKFVELPAGDHAVLAFGEGSDHAVDFTRVTFGPHTGPKCILVGSRPRDDLMRVTFGPHMGPKWIRVWHGRIVRRNFGGTARDRAGSAARACRLVSMLRLGHVPATLTVPVHRRSVNPHTPPRRTS